MTSQVLMRWALAPASCHVQGIPLVPSQIPCCAALGSGIASTPDTCTGATTYMRIVGAQLLVRYLMPIGHCKHNKYMRNPAQQHICYPTELPTARPPSDYPYRVTGHPVEWLCRRLHTRGTPPLRQSARMYTPAVAHMAASQPMM